MEREKGLRNQKKGNRERLVALIDIEVYQELKRRSNLYSKTMGSLVNDALKRALWGGGTMELAGLTEDLEMFESTVQTQLDQLMTRYAGRIRE